MWFTIWFSLRVFPPLGILFLYCIGFQKEEYASIAIFAFPQNLCFRHMGTLKFLLCMCSSNFLKSSVLLSIEGCFCAPLLSVRLLRDWKAGLLHWKCWKHENDIRKLQHQKIWFPNPCSNFEGMNPDFDTGDITG